MALDPQVKALLDQMAEAGAPPIEEMGVDAARQMYIEMSPPEPIEEVGAVEDRAIAGPAGEIAVRVYRPDGEASGAGVVYFHGGGWVIGDLQTHDHFCRRLANLSGAVLVAVDYRRAPEALFPAAAEDCIAATQWVAENAGELGIDADRLGVGGDSAGGNLAAVVAQAAARRGGPRLAFQLLLCPVTDHGFDTASYEENAEGYMLTRDLMHWFWDLYLGDDTARGEDPLASPLRGGLEGLPPAHVVTAEYDPLRDDGEQYADALRAAGGSVTQQRYEGQIHNFFTLFHVLERGATACDEIAEALRRGLARGSGAA